MTPRALRTALFVVVVVALGAYALARVRITADFAAFLPAGATPTQRALVQQLREGAAGRLLLIELSAAAPQRLAQASAALTAQLAQRPEFRYAANGAADQARRDLDFIVRHRYLLSPGVAPDRFDTQGLRAALAQRLEGLYGSAAPLEKTLLAQDPTGETLEILRRLMPPRAPRTVDGVWFDASGQRALLIAETAAPASDLTGQAAALAALNNVHASVAQDTKLAYTSPGALAVESRGMIAHEARLLSIVSALLIVIVLAVAYRAPGPVLLCAVPAAFGLLAGVCAVHAGLGRLNGITLAFAATLLGEAVDYPSFLFTQVAPGETAAAARARVGSVLRLAVLTTACGSLALLSSGFPGLVELGTLTAVGILAAGAVTWWVLPDWAPANIARAHAASRATLPPGLPFSTSVRWIAILALLGVLIALDRGHAWFDDDLANLNPLPSQYAARDRALRDALGAPDVRSLVMIRGRDEEDLLERAERLRPALEAGVAAREADGFDLPSDYLPSRATQARRQAALPARDVLHASLAAAVSGTPFRADAFVPFEDGVAAARGAPLLRAEDLAGTALGLRLSALLGRDGDTAYAVVPLRGVHDERALAARIAALRDPQVAWLDLREESAALLAAYRHQALIATGFGIALIYCVLGAGLRDARRGVQVLAPVLAAALVAAGALIALGVALTLFHLVALLLVIGIGVNYALFVERAARDARERVRVVRTLLVVSATTLCAFATLAFSSIPVLHALGATVCAGVVACLVVIPFALLPASRRVTVEPVA